MAEMQAQAQPAGYELTYITKADLADNLAKMISDKVESVVKGYKGEIVYTEDWGKKKLAYPIQKETRGRYTYVVYSGNNKLVAEIERNLRNNENIMRFLNVKITDDFDKAEFLKDHKPLSQREPAPVRPAGGFKGGRGGGFRDRGDRGFDRGDRGFDRGDRGFDRGDRGGYDRPDRGDRPPRGDRS